MPKALVVSGIKIQNKYIFAHACNLIYFDPISMKFEPDTVHLKSAQTVTTRVHLRSQRVTMCLDCNMFLSIFSLQILDFNLERIKYS